MRARLRLHLGALLIALFAPLPWVLLIWNDQRRAPVLEVLMFSMPGIVAAQIAAWLRWSALVRRAREGRNGWPAGVGMAVLTHLLFGVVVALTLFFAVGPRTWLGESSPWTLVPQALFFSLMSLGTCGFLTFIATALLAQHVAGRLRQEQAHDPA